MGTGEGVRTNMDQTNNGVNIDESNDVMWELESAISDAISTNSAAIKARAGYGDVENIRHDAIFESDCLLKTKADRYKTHFAVILGHELFCYRRKQDALHRLMHNLNGTFVKELESEY
jgi:hypothetical protein